METLDRTNTLILTWPNFLENVVSLTTTQDTRQFLKGSSLEGERVVNSPCHMVLRPFLYSWSKIERFVPLMHSTIHKASLFEAPAYAVWVSPFPNKVPLPLPHRKERSGAESRGERVDATRLRSWSDAPTSDASEPEIIEPRLLAARITHVLI